MGDTMNRSSSIYSINSAYLATDDFFSMSGGDASAEDSNENWEAIKTQHPTAALRRKRLTREAVVLSDDTTSKSIPRI